MSTRLSETIISCVCHTCLLLSGLLSILQYIVVLWWNLAYQSFQLSEALFWCVIMMTFVDCGVPRVWWITVICYFPVWRSCKDTWEAHHTSHSQGDGLSHPLAVLQWKLTSAATSVCKGHCVIEPAHHWQYAVSGRSWGHHTRYLWPSCRGPCR